MAIAKDEDGGGERRRSGRRIERGKDDGVCVTAGRVGRARGRGPAEDFDGTGAGQAHPVIAAKFHDDGVRCLRVFRSRGGRSCSRSRSWVVGRAIVVVGIRLIEIRPVGAVAVWIEMAVAEAACKASRETRAGNVPEAVRARSVGERVAGSGRGMEKCTAALCVERGDKESCPE